MTRRDRHVELTVGASLILFAALSAQNPRSSVLVNANTVVDARQTSVSSAGDLSAICWNEGGANNPVFIATSDGRGLTWSTPVRVDADTLTKLTQRDSVHVSGNNVYVVWEAGNALFFNRSTDRGATFGTPITLSVGGGNVRDWRVVISPDPNGDHIYVASSTAIADEDLFVTASHDSGTTFGSATLVPSVGALGDVDALAIDADGLTVHVAWDDNRSGRDSVYYQQSTDGGVTFLSTDLWLGDSIGVEDSNGPIQIANAVGIIAVLWNEEPGGSGNEVIEVNVSFDAGSSFQGAVRVGGYALTDDTDFGHVAIDAMTGAVFATWEDNRSGSDEAWVARSLDLGQTWFEVRVSSDGAENPQVLVTGPGRDDVIVAWESTAFPRRVKSALSTDNGATWGGDFVVSDNTGSVDFVAGGYNGVYNNFVIAWGARDQTALELFAGGFRPQMLLPRGFVAGQTANFDLTGFSGTHGAAFVVLSERPGFLPMPFTIGSQNLGLDPTGSLFTLSLSLPIAFATTLDGSGAGGTTPFTFNPIPGFSMYAAAFSFRVVPTIELDQLTDVQRVR